MSEEPPVDRRKLSTIPSWVMLGFVLGIFVMLGFRSRPPAPQAATPAPVVESPATEVNESAIADQPSYTVVEALFEQYRQYAFWEDDRTEIALWNTRTLDFTDYFEVLRTDTGTYYRSISTLTRLPLVNYGPPDCPIRFTETAAQRAARLENTRANLPRPAPLTPVELPQISRPPPSEP